ncbi:MAG: mechanosensitive ion channel [Pyrinomonadaceae bacterium]
MKLILAMFQSEGSGGMSITGYPALDGTVQNLVNYAPKVVGALLLLILAWIVASLLRGITKRGLKAVGADEKLNSGGGDSGTRMVSTISDVVYWIVFLCFIPAILSVLGITGILEPIQQMLSSVLVYLPNVLGAVLIFVLGMLVANIVRELVTSFLSNIGLDNFIQKHDVKTDFAKGGVSGLIGTIIYALILIAVLSASLGALKIQAISEPIQRVVDEIIGAIPNIFGAVLILIIAFIIAKIVRGIVTDVLTGIGFNKVPNAIGLTKLPTEGAKSASSFVGYLAFLAIILLGAIQASGVLKFALLADTINEITVIGLNILAGVVVLAIGMYAANIVAKLIKESGITNAGLLASVARFAIIFFAGAMALNRIGIADEIVIRAFTLLLGALAVAFAIAFGLGGREFASRMLEKASNAMGKE